MANIVLCILLTPISKTDRSHRTSLTIPVKNCMPKVIQLRQEVPLTEHCFFKAELCKVFTVMGAWAGPAGSKVPCNEFVQVQILEAEAKQSPFQF